MESKKIAILTLPLHGNYGGNLQCYALCKVLQSMGHEVKNINIQSKISLPWYKMPFSYSKRLIQKIFFKKKGSIFYEKKLHEIYKQNQTARDFINKHIPLTKEYNNKKSLRNFDEKEFDVYIVGSDQVWRNAYVYPSIETYFFDFLKSENIKKIAYAASFGTDIGEFTGKQLKKCGKLLQRFDAVSVREQSAIELINSYGWNCEAQHLLDPTFLLEKEDYLNLMDKNKINEFSENNLFYYVLDMNPDKQFIIDNLVKKEKLNAFTVNRLSTKGENNLLPPVEKWLRGFFEAKMVFTDSFHGCVFSIIFNKPFIAYGNIDRGMTRFNSLFTLFDIKDRLIFSSKEFNFNQQVVIDWEDVNRRLIEKRKKSIKFLIDNLY